MAAVSSHALMNWGAENGWNWAHQTIFVFSQPLELWINADTLFAPAWHCWHGTVSSGKPMLVSPLPKTLCIPPQNPLHPSLSWDLKLKMFLMVSCRRVLLAPSSRISHADLITLLCQTSLGYFGDG